MSMRPFQGAEGMASEINASLPVRALEVSPGAEDTKMKIQSLLSDPGVAASSFTRCSSTSATSNSSDGGGGSYCTSALEDQVTAVVLRYSAIKELNPVITQFVRSHGPFHLLYEVFEHYLTLVQSRSQAFEDGHITVYDKALLVLTSNGSDLYNKGAITLYFDEIVGITLGSGVGDLENIAQKHLVLKELLMKVSRPFPNRKPEPELGPDVAGMLEHDWSQLFATCAATSAIKTDPDSGNGNSNGSTQAMDENGQTAKGYAAYIPTQSQSASEIAQGANGGTQCKSLFQSQPQVSSDAAPTSKDNGAVDATTTPAAKTASVQEYLIRILGTFATAKEEYNKTIEDTDVVAKSRSAKFLRDTAENILNYLRARGLDHYMIPELETAFQQARDKAIVLSGGRKRPFEVNEPIGGRSNAAFPANSSSKRDSSKRKSKTPKSEHDDDEAERSRSRKRRHRHRHRHDHHHDDCRHKDHGDHRHSSERQHDECYHHDHHHHRHHSPRSDSYRPHHSARSDVYRPYWM